MPWWDRRGGSRRLLVRRLEAYVSLVTVGGLLIIASLVLSEIGTRGPWWPVRDLMAFFLLAGFTLASELLPIRIARHGEVEEITTSTTFAFATMVLWGAAPAVVVLAVASALADIVRRKSLQKILFNVGQYSIMMATAGTIFFSLGGLSETAVVSMPAFVAAAVAFFATNTFLTGVVVALSGNSPIIENLRREFRFNVGVAATLLAMSPVVVLVLHHGMGLVVLFVLPVAAVQFAAKGALERAALIEQLRGSIANLTELNRAKDEFVAIVSHELRTPLTSVRGYISTLRLLRHEMSSADVEASLEAADRQGARLQRQIERLLLVAKLETKREGLAPYHPVSISDLVRDTVTDMALLLANHRVILHVDEDVEPVTTDDFSVLHVVTNLIENAAKYSAPGTEIDIDVRRQDEGVLLAVRDRGCGISSEHRDRIFERFYQVDSSSTRAVGGTGLGLNIAATCARDVGGKVWLERSDGNGSVFCVYLPSLTHQPAEDRAERSVAPATTFAMSETSPDRTTDIHGLERIVRVTAP